MEGKSLLKKMTAVRSVLCSCVKYSFRYWAFFESRLSIFQSFYSIEGAIMTKT